MNERIHRVLDGELPRDALSAEERVTLGQLEAAIAAAERGVPRHVAPDLTSAIMARIAELDIDRLHSASEAAPATRPLHAAAPRQGVASRFGAALEWLWRPRPIAVRPAWALGAAVLAVALLSGLPDSAEPSAEIVAAPAATEAAAEIYVHFRLDAPNANSVHLAGDFTEWEPSYELHESQPGVWTVVVPLQAGVHDYAFVVDGQTWTPDPLATRVDDGFGGENSRLSLLPPERMRA